MVSVEGGPPRRLTDDPAANVLPTWSRDGNWIYFQSTRTGRPEIWKMPAAGGTATQITWGGGYYAVESIDGRYLYFTRREVSGLWKAPVGGGAEVEVFSGEFFFCHWALARDGFYFVNYRSIGQQWEYSLHFHEFGAARTRRVFREQGSLGPGMVDVSPDEKWIVCVREEATSSELMLVENFC
jgi:hypothetical protein